MKTAIIVILTLCLGVSLWINRMDRKEMRAAIRQVHETERGAANRESSPEKTSMNMAPREIMPKAPTMDFSGTAFEDDSWKLENKGKTAAPALGGLPSATLTDGDLQLGTIPDGPGQDAGAGQKKTAPFKSVLTNSGN